MIVNIQRDSEYVRCDRGNAVEFCTEFDWTATNGTGNSSGVVNADYASVFNVYGTAINTNANLCQMIGVLMNRIKGDRAPYRVKGTVSGLAQKGAANGVLMVGFGPATPNGADDVISRTVFLPFENGFDRLITIEEPASSLADRAVYFGVGIIAGEAISNGQIVAHLSCQYLGVKPPTMQNAVS